MNQKQIAVVEYLTSKIIETMDDMVIQATNSRNQMEDSFAKKLYVEVLEHLEELKCTAQRVMLILERNAEIDESKKEIIKSVVKHLHDSIDQIIMRLEDSINTKNGSLLADVCDEMEHIKRRVLELRDFLDRE